MIPNETIVGIVGNQLVVQPPFIGQGAVLQDTVVVGSPSQYFPSKSGTGFVHVRVTVSLPPPHVFEHVGIDHPPFIGQSFILQGTV